MVMRSDEDQPQPPRDTRKKKVPVRGILLLTVAVAAALAAAMLLTRYMEARVAAARVPTTRIVVAAVDIPVATPIQADWLQAIDWPVSSRPDGAVSDPAAVVNQVAVVPINRGEPVLPARLAVGGKRSGLATILEEGMRAVAVKVDDVIGVAGFIHPGDRVDVIVTMQPRQESPYVSKVVLQNVKVLAVGKDLEHRGKDAREAVPVTVATLMVTSDQSERLALSADRGHILLSLRGLADDALADTRGVTPPRLLLTDPEPTRVEPAVAVASPPPRPRPPRREVVPIPPAPAPERRQVVEILRGDLYEKRDFEPQEKHR
jgi:pilus assembly protein CpaB